MRLSIKPFPSQICVVATKYSRRGESFRRNHRKAAISAKVQPPTKKTIVMGGVAGDAVEASASDGDECVAAAASPPLYEWNGPGSCRNMSSRLVGACCAIR